MSHIEDYEMDDYEAELLCQGDYESVLQLRKYKIEKWPKDYHIKYKWADILVLTKKYSKAISVLSELHKENPEAEDVIFLILVSLRKANEKVDDFKWQLKPNIFYLNDELINRISRYLKRKKKENRTINSVYLHLLLSLKYLYFEEEDLFHYLKDSNRVHIQGNEWFNAWIQKIK